MVKAWPSTPVLTDSFQNSWSILRAITLCSILILSACKVKIIVPEGGEVISSSGAYSCSSGKTCSIDVVDLYFNETFSAKPAAGYKFKKWKKGERRLCGGTSKSCRVSTADYEDDIASIIQLYLDSPKEVFYLQPVFDFDCDEPQHKQTIVESVDGDDLSITVSDRFAGAVESLIWRDKEFINIWDHGRQISYAWHFDGYGECFNPTEPGSSSDYKAPTSTSELLSVCKPASNILITQTQPAFWMAPGQSVGYCGNGATRAINQTPVSDEILQKKMTISYQGLDNVIAFDALIKNPTEQGLMQAEIPTAYLTHEFSQFWNFNPQSRELTTPEYSPEHEPFTAAAFGKTPVILATENGKYAMGAYYAGNNLLGYGLYSFENSNKDNATNKLNIVIREEPYEAGNYEYQSFLIVGTLQQVQTAMIDLYKLHPTDITPPEGFVDVVDCNQIAGWAWDADKPDEALQVAIYDVNAQGKEVLVAKVAADVFRSDLQAAGKGNEAHGFVLSTPTKLLDGQRHAIRAYGLNPELELPPGRLYPALTTLECN